MKARIKFPMYILFGGKGGTAMCLTSVNEDGKTVHYYRHAGAWGSDAKYVNGVLKSCNHPRNKQWNYLNNKICIPTTKAVWKKKNEGYI